MKQPTQFKLAATAGFIGCLLASSTSADAVLSDFTFAIQANQDVSIRYQAFVAPWNGSLLGGNPAQGAGAPIWTGPVTTYTGDGTFQLITINTGALNLTDGDWVIGLDSSDATSYAYWGIINQAPGNGDGGFVFNNGPAVGVWGTFADFGDLAFSATLSTGNLDTFPSWNNTSSIGAWGDPQATQVYGQTFTVGGSVVPEASSSALAMGLGFVGLAFFRRFKR